MLLSLLLPLLAAQLGGCNAGFKPPRFRAVGVTADEISPEGVVLRFEVEAENPNKDPMPLKRAKYTLTLDGERVFTGERSPEATVRKFGTQRFDLLAVIPFEGGAPVGETRYEIRGFVTYQSPGQLNEVMFDSQLKVPKAGLAIGGVIDFGMPVELEVELPPEG